MALQTKTITANGSKGHHKFTLKVNEDTTSGNSSFMSFALTISPIQSGWDWDASGVNYLITVGSNTYTGPIYHYGGYSTETIESGNNIEIPHNSDGTKTINISFSITDSTSHNFTPGNASSSSTFKLTDLHKAPTLDSVSFVENATVLQNIGLNANDFVPYLSNKTITIQATPYDGATITQYKVINGTTKFKSSTNTVKLNFTTGIEMAYYYETSVSKDIPQLIIELTDDKGGVSSYNYTNTRYVSYARPNLVQTSSSVKRNGQLSGKVIMNLAGTFYGSKVGTKSNSVTLSYKYWKTNASEPTTYYPISGATTSGNVVNVTNWNVAKNNTPITDVDSDFAYYFKIKMVDAFLKESYITLNVPVGEYIRALLKDGVDFKNITIGLNPIVENGSNSNGNYIKYYDGTMICYKSVTASVAMTSAWGSLYEGSMSLGSWAEEFIGTPNVQVTNASAAGAMIESYDTPPTTTSVGTIFLARSNSYTANVTINVMGIGKWK